MMEKPELNKYVSITDNYKAVLHCANNLSIYCLCNKLYKEKELQARIQYLTSLILSEVEITTGKRKCLVHIKNAFKEILEE